MSQPVPADCCDVAVVVPAHRGGPMLDSCLAAIDAQHPRPAEVVVVADGPRAAADPALLEAVDRFELTLVVSPVAGGPARARNAGAASTAAAVLFFVDSDVVLAPDACATVAAVLADPELDGLFGSYDSEPGDPGFTSQYKNLVHHLTHQRAAQSAGTFWGACGAVRRTALAHVGGFDESYRRPCVEDIELGYRLRAGGRTVLVHPELQVQHLKRWTVAGLVRTDLLDRAVPWSVLILRSHTVVDDLGTERRARLQLALTGLAGLAGLRALAGMAGVGGLTAGASAAKTTHRSGRRRPAALVSVGLTAAVLLLDAPMLTGLARVRGPLFAARAVPWRLLHQWISALGLVIGAGIVGAERVGLRPGRVAELRSSTELRGRTRVQQAAR